MSLYSIITKIALTAKSPFAWILAVLSYLSPLAGVYYLLLIIVLADLITGLFASHKKRIPRSSKRFRRSFAKLLCYVGLIYLFFEFECKLGIEDIVCTYKVITGFIFSAEIISIAENMAVITEQPIFLKIVRLIRGKAEEKDKVLSEILKEKNE
mgnify:CR=1 FL=1